MLRYKIFRSLHGFLFKIEYFITYWQAKQCAKMYQQCSAQLLGYLPDYTINDPYREGTAIASLMLRELPALDIQEKIHDAVERANPKLVGGIIFQSVE